jgi:hypothetical protein
VFEPGSRPPDADVLDLSGTPRRLHEFRRRSHVLVLFTPSAEGAALAARHRDESQFWTWLQVAFVRPAAPGIPPGLHLVSRWGAVIASYPVGGWDKDLIESDLLRWEARDCCESGS